MSFLRKVSKVVSALSDNVSQKDIAPKLLEACKTGDIETVKECLAKRKDFDINWEEETSGFTPLKYAVYYGHYDIVLFLLQQNGIDTGICGGEYYLKRNYLDFEAPMHLAVCQSYKNPNKYLKIIDLLYKNGANINIETMQYLTTPLFAAIRHEYISIFKYLISKPDIMLNKVSGNKWNALHFAAFYNKKQIEIMQMLLEYGMSVNATAVDGSTPLHTAIRSWPMIETNNIQKQKIKLLIKYGADITKRDCFKKTAFNYCNKKDKQYFIKYAKQFGFEKNKLSENINMNNEEKDVMEILYPTPILIEKKQTQDTLLQQNEKLQTQIAMLEQKFERLIEQKDEKKNEKDNNTNGQQEIWQQEDEYKQFVEWLTNVVKLKQYLKNFEEDGWSDIRLVPDITKEELENLGIKRSGHQRIILKEVEKYKKKLEKEKDVEGANTNDYV
eukprot:195986_1